MRRCHAVGLLVLSMLVLAPVADVATASEFEIITFQMSGRVVKPDGTPKAGVRVALRLIHATIAPNTVWHTVSATSLPDGTFSRSFTTDGTYAIASINAQPANGYGATQVISYPTNGIILFGDLISGNCKNCPLPEDGSYP